MTFTEKEIKKCMAECDFTREEAIECLTIEANMVKPKNYTATTTEKKKVERERKPDIDKEAIIKAIADFLEDFTDVTGGVTIDNPAKMISFKYNGKPYTLDLKFARNKAKTEGTYVPQKDKK